MNSSLKARLERLGPVRAVEQVRSGSPVVLSLRPFPNREVKAVSATTALARRGLPLLRAKRAIEEMIANGRAVVKLPKVESHKRITAELAGLGIVARSVAERDINIRELRESLNLSQEQFALRYGIDLDALQNWERKRRKPDTAVRAYFRVIASNPVAASEAQEDPEMFEALAAEGPSA